MSKKGNGLRVKRILKKETRKLPVRLGDAEILEAGRKAAAISGQMEELEAQEEQAKAKAAAAKKQAENLDRDVRRLQFTVRQGSEDRDVEVITECDMRTGTVTERRTDTGEILLERDMTVEESQGVMFNDLANGPREDDEPIDVNPPLKALPPKRRGSSEVEGNA